MEVFDSMPSLVSRSVSLTSFATRQTRLAVARLGKAAPHARRVARANDSEDGEAEEEGDSEDESQEESDEEEDGEAHEKRMAKEKMRRLQQGMGVYRPALSLLPCRRCCALQSLLSFLSALQGSRAHTFVVA